MSDLIGAFILGALFSLAIACWIIVDRLDKLIKALEKKE